MLGIVRYGVAGNSLRSSGLDRLEGDFRDRV